MRKMKARQYNEKVAKSARDVQQWQNKTRKMLDENITHKCQKAEAQWTERKEKARQYNEEVTERVRDVRERQDKTRKMLEKSITQKCRKAEAQLNEQKEKAYQHKKKCVDRVREAQRLQAESAAKIRKTLEEGFRQKCEKAEAQLFERKEKALQHNDAVAERVRHVQQQLEKRQDIRHIKVKLEQKRGSKEKGDLTSGLHGSPEPDSADAGDVVVLEDTAIHQVCSPLCILMGFWRQVGHVGAMQVR